MATPCWRGQPIGLKFNLAANRKQRARKAMIRRNETPDEPCGLNAKGKGRSVPV
jgi:hypothetical protein